MNSDIITMCNEYSDWIDNYLTKNNITGFNGQLFKLELSLFMMCLAASDGIIREEETIMLNEYLDEYSTSEYYKTYISQNKICFNEFEKNVPKSLIVAVEIDNELIKKGESPKFSYKLLSIYKTVGYAMVVCDGEIHYNEKFDLQNYINIMTDYRIENILTRKDIQLEKSKLAKFKGQIVTHKTFGIGVILEIVDDVKLIVEFKGERKIFSYPYSFDHGFLSFINNSKNSKDDLKELNSSSKKQNLMPCFKDYNDFCEYMIILLHREIDYIKTHTPKCFTLYNPKMLNKNGNSYVYIFETDSEFFYPEDTPIIIYKDGCEISGCILYCEGFDITIRSSDDSLVEANRLKFSVETWWLLEALSIRLTESKFAQNEIAEKIALSNNNLNIQENIVTGQQNVIDKALNEDITFVWGPPGTGKTQTLANTAISFIKRNKRVLVVSYSNISVDRAILRIKELLEEQGLMETGKIVRYGYPREEKVIHSPDISSYNIAKCSNKEISSQIDNLIGTMRSLDKKSAEYVEIKKKMTQVKLKLKQEETILVSKALLVATTISKAIADDIFTQQVFDVVLFDEVSMAYIPQVVFAASLAKEHFCCFGDFCQLPPVVQSSNSPLNFDIFTYVGITEAVKSNTGHQWLVLLDEQRRMRVGIANFISQNMYNGLIKSHKNVLVDNLDFKEIKHFDGSSINFVDLSNTYSACLLTETGSRINIFSAIVSVWIACVYSDNQDVGIITPYNAQSKLINALLHDTLKDKHNITASTVHQFQGSEKTIIIYDVVDCYPMSYIGRLISAAKNDVADRLFNVAVTRSKSKFICIANSEYLTTKQLSSKRLFWKLINYCKTKNYDISANSVFKHSNDTIKTYNEANGINDFLLDIKNAQKEIYIDISGKENYNSEFFSDLSREILLLNSVNIYIRVINKSILPTFLQQYLIENKQLYNSAAIIDNKIVWYNLPFSENYFITSGKTVPTKYNICLRVYGDNFAKIVLNILNMDNRIDQFVADISTPVENLNTLEAYITTKIKCSKCGGQMQMKKSKKGRIYLSCTNALCDTISFPDNRFLEIANDYLYLNNIKCPHDGTTLEAVKGQYGPFIRCNALNQHKFSITELNSIVKRNRNKKADDYITV